MLDPNRTALVALLAAACLLPACATDDEIEPLVIEDTSAVYLSPVDHLVRASMALRGIRPSIDDINRVANDPSELEVIVDEYLESPHFGRIVRDMYAEALLTRTDYFLYPSGFAVAGSLAGYDTHYLNTSLQEGTTRLVEHVVTNDLPFTEIVTADYQVMNEVGSRAWGASDYQSGADEWQVVHYDDGRPTAGVLSDPYLFTRHASTYSNGNRGRANAISKALLCYDFLSRDIELDSSIDLADPDVVATALVDNPACASCHQTLDPFASFFRWYLPLYVPTNIPELQTELGGNLGIELPPYPFETFYTKNLFSQSDVFELNGFTLRDSAYFGQPGETVADLGQLMAEDARLSLCATQRFYGYLTQMDVVDVPLIESAKLQETFILSGYNGKALAKAVVLSDSFRLSHHEDEALADNRSAVFKIRPDQLSPMFYDLTGYIWQTRLVFDDELGNTIDLGQVDLTTDSFLGYEVLGGGIDGQYVTRPAHTFNASSSLFLQTLAAQAAPFVVERDFAADATERKLLWLVEPTDTDEAAIRVQLGWLHTRLYGELVADDGLEVDETWALFSGALEVAQGDTLRAWETTLTAMLQDHRIATY
jgi:hypothetical protein